jgi:putative FmdB family regulatory protein
MPIYEYECQRCHKKTSVLTMRVSQTVEAVCRHCSSRSLKRLMSRFATPRSEESRLDAMSDPSKFADLNENDPRSVARAMRRMGREMGDELGGPEFDEAVDELEAGGDLDDPGGQPPGDDTDDL